MIGNNSMGDFNVMLENNSNLVISADDLTHELAMKVIPVTGLILTLAFLGLFGNILILIVYSKYYRMSNFRYFVLCLAYIDLLSCVTTLPAEAHTQVNWFTFRFDALCKIKSFLNVFTIFSSALTLLFLASDRYNKICHPFSRQIEPPLAWRLCVISMIVSAVMASPTAVFWGTQTFVMSSGNSSISVKICEKSDLFADRLYPLVYIMTAFSLPVCSVMLLTAFCNVMIVRKLVHGNSTLTRTDCRHLEMESYKAATSGLQTVSEGRDTTDQVKLHNGCKHSLKFLRHHSFPAVKWSARKKIYYCDRCDKAGSSYAGSVYPDNALNGIRHDSPVTSSVHSESRKHNGTYHVCHNEQSLNERGRCSIKSNSAGKQFSFKTVRNGKRKRRDTSLKHTLCINKRDSSTVGDIQAIYEKHSSQTADRRTSHVSEMDISKADSITLQGLHRWKVWREQALMRKAINSRRKTLIMMILSSVFILTIVIYFTLVILVADVDGIFRNMPSTSKMVVFFFFWRLYFINSVINPILYGLLDQRFRKGLAKLCCNRRLYEPRHAKRGTRTLQTM